MERFVWPYLTNWALKVKEMGAYAILHSDGDLMPYLDKIANSGVDALQAIDPVAGMDMRTVKDQVGNRLCLCGNLDCGLMVTGSPEQVFEATRDLLVTCKDGGGLVLGASNALQQEVPAENYLALVNAWKEFGVY
jgi:uroporphyrinogen decarboxylase